MHGSAGLRPCDHTFLQVSQRRITEAMGGSGRLARTGSQGIPSEGMPEAGARSQRNRKCRGAYWE